MGISLSSNCEISRNSGVRLLLRLVVEQRVRLALKLPLRLLHGFGVLELLFGVLFVQSADGVLAEEKAVEDAVESQLLVPRLGVNGAQRGFYNGAVVKAQLHQDAHGVGGLVGRDVQSLLPQYAPE